MKNVCVRLLLFVMGMVSFLHIAKVSKIVVSAVESIMEIEKNSALFAPLLLEDMDFPRGQAATKKSFQHARTNHSSASSVVVVYTGPTKNSNVTIGKNEIYHKNFEYFLKHGIDCSRTTTPSERHDTVLVLTQQVAKEYQSKISSLQDACRNSNGNSITVLERQDRCYDMESMRVVLQKVDLSLYDYLVYVNCGLVGPKISTSKTGSWTQVYTSLLSDKIKMSGLTINCRFRTLPRLPKPTSHVQSMLFAVDRVGLQIIRDSKAIYDCGKSNAEMNHNHVRKLIYRYEMGMGKAILQAGYGLQSTLGPMGPVKITSLTIPEDSEDRCRDMWYHKDLLHMGNNGTIPAWEDLVFFKSTRDILLEDVQAELNYEGNFWEYIGDKHF